MQSRRAGTDGERSPWEEGVAGGAAAARSWVIWAPVAQRWLRESRRSCLTPWPASSEHAACRIPASRATCSPAARARILATWAAAWHQPGRRQLSGRPAPNCCQHCDRHLGRARHSARARPRSRSRARGCGRSCAREGCPAPTVGGQRPSSATPGTDPVFGHSALLSSRLDPDAVCKRAISQFDGRPPRAECANSQEPPTHPH